MNDERKTGGRASRNNVRRRVGVATCCARGSSRSGKRRHPLQTLAARGNDVFSLLLGLFQLKLVELKSANDDQRAKNKNVFLSRRNMWERRRLSRVVDDDLSCESAHNPRRLSFILLVFFSLSLSRML